MSRGFPSMTALLGLLAVAGYQNRDKIAEMLKGAGSSDPSAPGQVGRHDSPIGSGGSLPGAGVQQSGLGGVLGGLGGGGLGGLLGGGLGELLDNFKQNGHGDVAESWIGTGPNKQVDSTQLERAIGPDVLATLSAQTGLSREELLSRLSTTLPDAVDRYTPDGRLPPTTDL